MIVDLRAGRAKATRAAIAVELLVIDGCTPTRTRWTELRGADSESVHEAVIRRRPSGR